MTPILQTRTQTCPGTTQIIKIIVSCQKPITQLFQTSLIYSQKGVPETQHISSN